VLVIPVIDCVPDEYEVCGPSPEYSVLTPLAVSEDGYQLVAVETRLLPDNSDEYELKFCIAVLDESSEDPFRIFDPRMAQGYIPDEVRSLVMPCVCGAIRELIRCVQPRVIHRVTFVTRPDEKALEKHHLITDTVQSSGLTHVETGTDRFERKFWRMSRNGGEHGEE
jgi:hypothetical protein